MTIADCVSRAWSSQASILPTSSCHVPYSWANEDTGLYTAGWQPVNKSEPSMSAWTYQSAKGLGTSVISGRHATYSGGGFAVELASRPEDSTQILQTLEKEGWVDRQTRVILVEFTTYNANMNLFTIVVIMFEFTNTGELQPLSHIMMARFFPRPGSSQAATIIFQCIYVIFILVFVFREIKRFLSFGSTCEYLTDTWTYVEIGMICLSICTVGVFFHRLVTVKDIMQQSHASHGKTHVSFYLAALLNYALSCLLAAMVLLVTVKFLKLLKFVRRIHMLLAVLRYALAPLSSVMFMLLMVFVCYTLVAILVLGPYCADFSSVPSTIIVLITISLNELHFDPETCATMDVMYVIAPVYIMVVGTGMVTLWVPFLKAILDNAIITMDRCNQGLKNEMEIIDFILMRLSILCGCHDAQVSEDEDRDPGDVR